MEIDIRMPALSAPDARAKLTRWLKPAGAAIHAGDILAEIVSGTTTMEIEAEASGVLTDIVVAAGTGDLHGDALLARMMQSAQAPSPASAAVEPAAPEMQPAPARETGDFPAGTRTISMSVRDALRDALAEEMRRDGDVFVIGEEVAGYNGPHKVTQGLLDEFGPQRVVDTPITEHAFAGLGVGAAFAGLRPVVEFMSFSFALQAADQIINSAAKARYISGGQIACPIVFRGPNGTAPGVAAQHGQDYSALFSNVPGLKVVAPYSAADAKGLLKSAIRDPNPVVFLENEILYGETGEVPQVEDWLVPIGKARIARAGHDVTIVSFSIGMVVALKAAQMLAGQGIEAEVVDLRTLRPLDTETLVASVKKTGRCVSVEEGWPQCGIGAEIAAQMMDHAFDQLKAPVARVTGADVPMPYAAKLEKLALPGVNDVIAAVMKVLRR